MAIYAHPSSVVQGLGYGVQQGTALSNQESTMQSFREQREKEMAQSYLSSALQAKQLAMQAYANNDRVTGDKLLAQSDQLFMALPQTKTGPGVNNWVPSLSAANQWGRTYESTDKSENKNPFLKSEAFEPYAQNPVITQANSILQNNAQGTNNAQPQNNNGIFSQPPFAIASASQNTNTTPVVANVQSFPSGINLPTQANNNVQNGFNPQMLIRPQSQPASTPQGPTTTTTRTGTKFTGNLNDWSQMIDINQYQNDPELYKALLGVKQRHASGKIADPKLQQTVDNLSQMGQAIDAKLNQARNDLWNELYRRHGYETVVKNPDGTTRTEQALDMYGRELWNNQINEFDKVKSMLAPISLPGWTRNIATPEDFVAIDKLKNYEEQQKNSSFGLKLNYYTPDQLESYLNNLKGVYSQLSNIDFKGQARALGASTDILLGSNPYNPSQSGGATPFGLHTVYTPPPVEKMQQFQMPKIEEPKPQTLDTSASNVTKTTTPSNRTPRGPKPSRTVNYPTADNNGSFSAVADTTAASTATTIPNLVNMVVTATDGKPENLQSASLAEAHWGGLKSKMVDNTLGVTIPNKKNKQYIIDQTKSNYADIITQIVADVSTIPKTNSKDKVVNLGGYELISGNVNGELKILGVAKKDKNGKMGRLYSMGEVYALKVPGLDNIGDLQNQMKKLIDNIYNQIRIPDKDVISTTMLDPNINHSWSDATLKQSLGPDLFFGSKVASQSEIDGINSGKIQWAQHK